jgi:surfactin synthase thioesterase subunit
MAALVKAIEAAITPYLDHPFAFFGHSMGAAIAFELARSLRRHGKTLPLALYVSGARAPQFRLNWTPPPAPDDRELLQQLRRLDGIPSDVLDNPQMMEYALPVLRRYRAISELRVYVRTAASASDFRVWRTLGSERQPGACVEAWRDKPLPCSCGASSERALFHQLGLDDFLRALLKDVAVL